MDVILCCGGQGRAVLFGRVDSAPVPGAAVVLRDARMVLYWSAACGGLLGLAATGPREGTRMSAAVVTTTDLSWQQCLSVSDAAATALRDWPVYRG